MVELALLQLTVTVHHEAAAAYHLLQQQLLTPVSVPLRRSVLSRLGPVCRQHSTDVHTLTACLHWVLQVRQQNGVQHRLQA